MTKASLLGIRQRLLEAVTRGVEPPVFDRWTLHHDPRRWVVAGLQLGHRFPHFRCRSFTLDMTNDKTGSRSRQNMNEHCIVPNARCIPHSNDRSGGYEADGSIVAFDAPVYNDRCYVLSTARISMPRSDFSEIAGCQVNYAVVHSR